MSALKENSSYSREVEAIRKLSVKVIQRPVKLAGGADEQASPSVPLMMQNTLEAEFGEGAAKTDIRETSIQIIGVLLVFAACWSLGVTLYAHL